MTTAGLARRQLITVGCAFLAYVILYQLLCMWLPAGSVAALAVSNVGLCVVELASLVLVYLAFRRTTESRGRLIWLFVGLWLALNLLADAAWSYTELVEKASVSAGGLADLSYLASYVPAFCAMLTATWKASGGLRTLETLVDAAMLTIGVAGVAWAFLVGPLLGVAEPGLEYWLSLVFPVVDLLIVFGFMSFFLNTMDSWQEPLRPYYLVLCVAFMAQVAADAGFFVLTATGGEYDPGSWMDAVWLCSFGLAGWAALLETVAAAEGNPALARTAGQERTPRSRHGFTLSLWRILIPYMALAVIVALTVLQLEKEAWRWQLDSKVLTSLGTALVAVLLLRQYLVLSQNRRLNLSLHHASAALEAKVDTLADLNQRLEALNGQAQRLNSLHDFREVAEGGLELACSFARCPGGWLTVRDDEGAEVVIAARGAVEHYHPGSPRLNAVDVAKGVLRAVPLDTHGESVGTIWLVRPAERRQGADLLPVIATHVATALDNAKRYEEAVHLAERDALTGLYNHRGIHRRLAGEALRAQQNGSELSLIMMDLDDFKALNDSYGHPAGDTVLRQVSEGIRSVLRHADLAGRVGGDELLVVLPNTGTEGALQLCERLRNALLMRPYVTADGQAVPVNFSLGVATYPGDAQSLGQLIETADGNLYASKQRGGNTTTGSLPEVERDPVDAGKVLGVAGRLLNVVGARDHYTRRHSENVALYALSLGEACGLSDESLATLHVAAMLHDVGKIGVSGDLLRKPGPLDPGEEDMMRRHVDLSAAVINDMPRLAQVAEAVKAHHEHHDGSGYPGEIQGEDIPLLGRILSIADAYSAMTLDRPYRRSLTHDQARAELLKAAGSQFDPRLVSTFLGVLEAEGCEPQASRAEAG